jgi:hypothetical protein
LYDATKKVTPTKKKNAKTKVIVTWKDGKRTIVVTRMNSPKRLEYIEDGITYNNEEAQAHIDRVFGPESLWHITAYAAQLSFHPLVTQGGTEATASFFALVDGIDNPKDAISRLTTQLAVEEKLLQRNQEELGGRKCNHDTCPPTTLHDLSPLVSRVRELQSSLLSATSGLEVAMLVEELSKLPNVDKTLEELEEEREGANEDYDERRKLLRSQLRDTKLNLTALEAQKQLKLATQRDREQEKVKGIVQYDKKAIQDYIDVLGARMDAKKAYSRIVSRRRELQEKMNGCSIDNSVLDKLPKWEEEMREVEKILSSNGGDPCPSCGELLSHVHGKLVVGGVSKSDQEKAKERKKELSTLIALGGVMRQRKNTLDVYSGEYNTLILPKIVPEWTDVDENVYYLLKNVVVVENVTYSVEELSEYSKQIELRRELEEIPETGRALSVVEGEISVVKQRMKVEKELAGRSEKRSVEEVQAEIVRVREELTSVMGELEEKERCNKLYEAHRECSRVRELTNKYGTTSRHISLLSEAITVANKEYAERTTNTINAINHHLDRLVPHLVDIDLRVQLAMTRSGQKGKPLLEICAWLDGEEINFYDISGGEKVKSSFALLLACYSYARPLFLILDEPVHSIDAKWEDAMIEMVKSEVNGGVCIVTSFTDMGQHVDSIVNVSKQL